MQRCKDAFVSVETFLRISSDYISVFDDWEMHIVVLISAAAAFVKRANGSVYTKFADLHRITSHLSASLGLKYVV